MSDGRFDCEHGPERNPGCPICEIERLREAIKRESKKHVNTLPVEVGASLMCECEICWIAREGR